MPSAQILPLYHSARIMFENILPKIEEAQLQLRLHPNSTSLGWNLRHIAEVELGFMAMFFGTDVGHFEQGTIPPGKPDLSQYNQLEPLLELHQRSKLKVEESIINCPPDAWDEVVESPLGNMTRRNAMGILLCHTGYHAGQIGMTLKYSTNAGNVEEGM